jgi:hypothetical protein
MSMNIRKHLSMLGLRVQDRVTGMEGVVVSIGFDLYGCIQAIVNPGLDKDGKHRDQNWFDIARLKVIDDQPVMKQPDWDYGVVARGKKGAAPKPAMSGC